MRCDLHSILLYTNPAKINFLHSDNTYSFLNVVNKKHDACLQRAHNLVLERLYIQIRDGERIIQHISPCSSACLRHYFNTNPQPKTWKLKSSFRYKKPPNQQNIKEPQHSCLVSARETHLVPKYSHIPILNFVVVLVARSIRKCKFQN